MLAQPFTISISQAVLDDLHDRLARTRWPDGIREAGWAYGSAPEYVKELVSYWRDGFDWKKQERYLNRFSHFHTEIEGLNVHFIHVRRTGRKEKPLLLLHGWPSSFIQMLKIIPYLEPSFDLVIPSLIGYGFSQASLEPGMSVGKMAGMFHSLMTDVLGYNRYAIRGGDLGAGVLSQMAVLHPEAVIGTHSGGTYPWVDFEHLPPNLTPAEKEFVANVKRWREEEMGYAVLHATKPQTLAYALNDSPAGLAAWIIEKFRRWSDCDGSVERRFTKDELLTNLTIYWATGTINSSMRLYYETTRNPGNYSAIPVPHAMLMPSKDMFPTPKEWIERQGTPARYTEIDRGGHFLEWEEPEIVARDILEFLKDLS
ncbi:MAG TPA: epoxide hydrolase [Methanoregula sp.]|nr:epoxide hydrolase [Methanoregula sp.]